MLVAEPLLRRLGGLVLAAADRHRDASAAAPSVSRKHLRIFLDAFMEQVVDNLIGARPANSEHARDLIRTRVRSELPRADEVILLALRDALAEGSAVLHSDSLEARSRMGPFLSGAVRRLVLAACSHSSLAEIEGAQSLAVALGAADPTRHAAPPSRERAVRHT